MIQNTIEIANPSIQSGVQQVIAVIRTNPSLEHLRETLEIVENHFGRNSAQQTGMSLSYTSADEYAGWAFPVPQTSDRPGGSSSYSDSASAQGGQQNSRSDLASTQNSSFVDAFSNWINLTPAALAPSPSSARPQTTPTPESFTAGQSTSHQAPTPSSSSQRLMPPSASSDVHDRLTLFASRAAQAQSQVSSSTGQTAMVEPLPRLRRAQWAPTQSSSQGLEDSSYMRDSSVPPPGLPQTPPDHVSPLASAYRGNYSNAQGRGHSSQSPQDRSRGPSPGR
jgi:hypothetical protein